MTYGEGNKWVAFVCIIYDRSRCTEFDDVRYARLDDKKGDEGIYFFINFNMRSIPTILICAPPTPEQM